MNSSETPVFSHRSVAHVPTDRPARYGRQLVAHMGRKITTSRDDDSATGLLSFDLEGPVTGVVELACDDGALVLTLRTTAEPGTTQGPPSEEDIEAQPSSSARRGR